MSWNILNKLSTVVFGSVGGASVYYYLKASESKLWDYNWDKRDAKNVDGATGDKNKLEKHQSKATRHIILIRHGQFKKGETDIQRILTTLGRKQAEVTGKRLAEMELPITEIVVLTLARAQETGKVILEQLPKPQRNGVVFRDDKKLIEGAPIQPQPVCESGDWDPEPHFFKDGSRIEAAFRDHFYRADPSQEKDSCTVLVCHANVIRYFVCRALQFPPEAWLRFDLTHASITWLALRHDGLVYLRMFNSSGHLPEKLVTSVNE